MCAEGSDAPGPVDSSAYFRYFQDVMARFGLGEFYALFCDGGQQTLGLSRKEALDRVRSSAMLINVMGFLTDEDFLGCAPRTAFLNIDPGFGQMWQDLGLWTLFQGHDAYIT